jgi:tRNA threonylcarbamoyladenosine biosynthesis protein TsaB
MLSLAFDTSASSLSIALFSGQKLLTQNTIHESGKQAELLIPEIEKILIQNQIWYQDLGLISTSKGPGSFTGVRIGLVVARILRLSTNLPLVLVNSCEVFAHKNRQISGKIFALLDAGIDEFFFAEFFAQNQKIEQIVEPGLVRFGELLEIFPQDKFFLCGSGKKFAAEILKKENFEFEMEGEGDEIGAESIGLLALEKFQKGEQISENLNPIYLRAPRISERKK